MRHFTLLLSALFTLAGCTPSVVEISADKCWSVSVGERVQGTAILHAYAGKICIECGAYLTSTGCPAMTGLASANQSTDQSYDRLVRTSPIDSEDYVVRKVFLSGQVVPDGASGRPMIQADQLRPAE
jgi:hypothetical protein